MRIKVVLSYLLAIMMLVAAVLMISPIKVDARAGALGLAAVGLLGLAAARVRKLAEEIICSQGQEIADMRKWLAKMGR